jgi:hypothetical protein
VLEEEASHPAAFLLPDDDQRSSEALNIEVLLKLLGVPDLTMLLFESLTIPGVTVDLLDHGASDRFGGVSHRGVLL